jgi:hypothetical protein
MRAVVIILQSLKVRMVRPIYQAGDLVLYVPSRNRGNIFKLGIVLKERDNAVYIMWSNHHKQRCRPRNIQHVQKIN